MASFTVTVRIDAIVSQVNILATDENSARNRLFSQLVRDNPGHEVRIVR